MTTLNHKVLHRLLPVAAVAIFCLAIWILVKEAHSISLADIVAEFKSLSSGVLVASGLLAVTSYGILTLYDYIALRYVSNGLPYLKVAPVSFAAFAIGHNVGLSSLSGGAIRYRAYSLAGLSASRIALLVGFIPLTYGLGAAILLGITLMVDPVALKVLPVNKLWLQLLGGLLLAFAVAYVGWNLFARKPLQLGGWVLRPPGPKIGPGQCLLGSLDLVVASSVLYVLLHASTDIGFLPFLGAFLLAMVAGVVSNVPGAVGVFESAMLLLLPDIPAATLLGSILAYRLIYYLIPLVLALSLVVAHELFEHRSALQGFSQRGMAWGERVMPQAVGAMVFFVGAYLVIGAALPLTSGEEGLLERLIPLPLLEMSHLLSSAIGVGLLLLARGLYRRLHGAYRATLVLLGIGAILVLVHRDSLLQASFLLLILLLTWLSRAGFYRGRRLLEQRFDVGWLLSIALVLVVAAGLSFFVHTHEEYSTELWWQFTLEGDVSRVLRAGLLAMLIVGVFAVLRLIRPRPHGTAPVSVDELARARPVVAQDTRSDANLALLGDKRFLFHPDGDAMLMYQQSGGSFIVMGDPVGNPLRFEELAWNFRELCDVSDMRCVFYEVGARCLPVYIDLGLSFSKLGEEARVKLENFDLASSGRSRLRQALNRAKRDGAEFSVLPASEVGGVIADLQRVSDHWLKAKGMPEKGFSLGFFDTTYLANFDCAVVRVEGEIVAFANLWQGADRQELSIDLMRFGADAPKGVMDYLITELMLWGREQGFRWFSLGMAPLAGLEGHTLAPAWDRLGNLVYRFGEHFCDFEGLRHYKEKYQPEWSPRYLACKGGINLPAVLLDTTTLISRGVDR